MFGREHAVPRLVGWYGDSDVGYRYSGAWHQAEGWISPLRALARRLDAQLGLNHSDRFNFVLLNRYRTGADHMGWHADDEAELGPEPIIASVSLGCDRVLRIRPKQRPAQGSRRSRAITLEHGSLLVMRGRSQRDWQHALTRARGASSERLNLTFRRVVAG